MNNKNSLISFLQVFGIILVVIGHSDQGAPNHQWWYTWIYSFHMPLFMFISGFLLQYGCNKKNIYICEISLLGRVNQGFIIKKIKRLLLPYCFISTIAFIPRVLFNNLTTRHLDLSFSDYVNTMVYPWENVIIFFWFLPTLFIIFMIVVLVAKWLNKMSIKIPAAIVLSCLVLLHLFNPLVDIKLFNISGVVNYLLYFVLGCYVCKYNIIDKIFSKHFYINSVILIVCSLVLVFVIPSFVGKDILTALIGISLSIFIAKIYNQNQYHFLDHLFGASYAIYLFSWFPQVASQQVFLGITHAPWQIGSVLAIVTGIYIPFLIYKMILKYKNNKVGKYIALLTGQN